MHQAPIWVMYFGGLVAIKAHPKNGEPPDLKQCASIADEMLALTIQRFPEEIETWPDGQQPHKPG